MSVAVGVLPAASTSPGSCISPCISPCTTTVLWGTETAWSSSSWGGSSSSSKATDDDLVLDVAREVSQLWLSPSPAATVKPPRVSFAYMPTRAPPVPPARTTSAATRSKRLPPFGVHGGVLKQRRRAMGGRYPSISDLASFAGPLVQTTSADVTDSPCMMSKMRKCQSMPNLAAGAAPWKVYEEWRTSNPAMPRGACRTFVEGLLTPR